MLKSFFYTLDNKLEYFFTDTFIGKELYKFFNRQKSFWTAVSILISFLVGEAIALSYGQKLSLYFNKQTETAEENEPVWLYEICEIFFANDSWIIFLIFLLMFIVLVWIKIKELNLNDSIDNFLESLKVKIESVLFSIHTNIQYKDKIIEIDRSSDIQEFKEHFNTNNIFVISGKGGVGKTAIVKKIYNELKNSCDFYIFKATEFNINNIDELFKNNTFNEFINATKNKEKIIVIDSSEKLLDISNNEPFKEILSILIKNSWKIIFTTRDNYLNDLNFEFIEVYKIKPLNIHLKLLTNNELEYISNKFNFDIPKDQKLVELIKNPFYLDEYLSLDFSNELTYIGFRENLWDKKIKKHSEMRERFFLEFAKNRVVNGKFFIDTHDKEANDLFNDGILGKELAGYFITHDIYEEWALEKNIEISYLKKINHLEFFQEIGSQLAIRRSFRAWLSEKLLTDDQSIKKFINDTIECNEIENYWKDEVLVSILLSNYVESFISIFKDELLKDDFELLKKLVFLLRIACKEVDDDYLKLLGLKNINQFLHSKYIFTKPKGKGWNSLIKFIYENIEQIKYENISFILPILHEYNSKFKNTTTTKHSSLLALNYYKWMMNDETYRYKGNLDKTIQIIIYGVSEIKTELSEVFDEILENNYINHNEPYYELAEYILTKIDASCVSKELPKKVIQLAALYWYRVPEKDNWHYSKFGVEDDFCIDKHSFNYYPASAYQTPIYFLLQSDLKSTIDFIIEFTNKTLECYIKSELKNESETITIDISENKSIEQRISARLWNMYRGTQVSTDLLESIHMALEKFLLERAENTEKKTLEYYLKYLLENSKSASITAVVSSIVLAFPDKTFNIALILFKTKELFEYDLPRALNENDKGMYTLGMGLNHHNKIYDEERLKTLEDKHRKTSLENLFLNYQLFRTKEVSEQVSEERQKALWKILDNYYLELPSKDIETYQDKTWKMYLARMDKRKMNITTEEKEEGILLNFNPELEPDLQEFSQSVEIKNQETTKYSALYLWSRYKLERNEDFKNYKEYEDDYHQTLNIVKEFLSIPIEERNKYILHESIPSDVCSVLIRENLNQLSNEDKAFCKDVIIDFATLPFQENYHYQVSSGVESVISVLPILMKEYPQEKEKIKMILFLHLFNDYPIGMSGKNFYDFALSTIDKYLWNDDFEEAQSLLIGYILLKPKYEVKNENKIKETYQNNYFIDTSNRLENFINENEQILQKVLENKIVLNDINIIDDIDLYILKTTFKLIPSTTRNELHKQISNRIIHRFTIKLLDEKREEKVRYEIKIAFFIKLSEYLLNSEKKDIKRDLQPLIDNFNGSEIVSDFFEQLIYAQDRLKKYDNFWFIWSLFSNPIIELCKKGDGYWYIDKIIKSYLFANTLWNENIKDWHTLNNTNSRFFKQISENTGHCPSTLYSISKLLNGVGGIYLIDGIYWLESIINQVKDDKIDEDTIYYLESVIRKFIFEYKKTIRKDVQLKIAVLVVLEYLIERQSAVAYMLRETIY